MIINKIAIFTFLTAILLTGCSSNTDSTINDSPETNEDEIKAVKFDELLRDSLEFKDGVEVIMNYFEAPKNTSFSAHYHHAEEFIYMLQGSGELSLKDKPKRIIKAGDVVKIPYKHVHSFLTIDEEAKAVIFSVHEKGQPDRTSIE